VRVEWTAQRAGPCALQAPTLAKLTKAKAEPPLYKPPD